MKVYSRRLVSGSIGVINHYSVCDICFLICFDKFPPAPQYYLWLIYSMYSSYTLRIILVDFQSS